MHEEIWTIITIYGENGGVRKEEKDKFFEELQRQIDNGKKQTIIMVYMKGRVGNRNNV